MKKWITLGLTIFLVILFSCKKDHHFDDSIVGEWQWIKSTASEIGAALTADTTFFIEFTSDGYYYYYNNSKRLTMTSRYELSFDTLSKFYKLLNMDHPEYRYRYRIKEDTLSVNCIDCCQYCLINWIQHYKRKN